MNIDACFISGIIILFIYLEARTHFEYTMEHVFIAALTSVLNNLSSIFAGKAVLTGPAGVVHSVNSLSSVVQLVLAIAIQHAFPTGLQFIGITLTLCGASIVTKIDEFLVRLMK